MEKQNYFSDKRNIQYGEPNECDHNPCSNAVRRGQASSDCIGRHQYM
ncbi:hypothetical protein [Bacillus sp. 1P06AnD]